MGCGGGKRCPCVANVPFASLAGGDESGVASGVTLNVDASIARGYRFATNNSDVFYHTQDNFGRWGIGIKKSGLYIQKWGNTWVTNNAIVHATTMAFNFVSSWLDPLGFAFTTQIDYDQQEPAAFNHGQTAATINAAPQLFETHLTQVVNAPDGNHYPTQALISNIYQDSGFTADALPALWITRLSDPVVGGI